jgi:SOS-response transcriptional repressor LexA
MEEGEKRQIYLDLMRFKPERMTPNAWATKAGVSRTVWADMRRHGNPSRRTLEKLLTAAGSSLAEFEALRIGAAVRAETSRASGLHDVRPGWGVPILPSLPLLASAIAGEWGDGIELTELREGEIVDRLPRPPSLANDPGAYAITIVGDSMWPRFRPGRRVAISPRSPVAIGDDVLVKLKSGAGESIIRVMVKELVRKGGSGVELQQFKPEITFHVPAEDVAAIEKVVGELI